MSDQTWEAGSGVKALALAKLGEPMEDFEVSWRVGRKLYGSTVLALCYIDARAARDRLDALCGPYWSVQYTSGPQGGVLAAVSILVEGEWITRQDGADLTKVESIKGGYSDAFKRACGAWGIGRDLYGLGDTKLEAGDQYPKDVPSNRVVACGKGLWAVAPHLVAARKGHHPTADKAAKRRFHAKLKDAALDYEVVKEFCSSSGWPTPFSVSEERREALLEYFQGDAGRSAYGKFKQDLGVG
tara:strand:+ start:228 stop:953 length:726 start_codon:yes stop_codon:yes gene_type:complete